MQKSGIKLKKNPDNAEYKEDVKAFIKDMKPYNEKLKNNEISKIQYIKIGRAIIN